MLDWPVNNLFIKLKIVHTIPFQFNSCKNHKQKARQWDPNYLDFQKHNKMDSVLPLQAWKLRYISIFVREKKNGLCVSPLQIWKLRYISIFARVNKMDSVLPLQILGSHQINKSQVILTLTLFSGIHNWLAASKY